jgi:hypothetical protein
VSAMLSRPWGQKWNIMADDHVLQGTRCEHA